MHSCTFFLNIFKISIVAFQVFLKRCIAQSTSVEVLSTEMYSEYSNELNQNVDNYWDRSPAFPSDPILSYQCVNYRNWNPEFLLLSMAQTLTKHINTLAYTSGVHHYSVTVELQLFLIDVNDKNFKLELSSPEAGVNFSIPSTAEDPFIQSAPNYCTESLISKPCIDYCKGPEFDSQVTISRTFSHNLPNLTLSVSSSSLKDTTFIGIFSLNVSVEVCDTNCLMCETISTKCTKCDLSLLPWLQLSTFLCVADCTIGEYKEFADGMTYLNDTCIQCSTEFCKTCDSSNCYECKDNYYLNGTTCELCNSSLFCFRCADDSSCLSCVFGYYLLGSSCVRCPDGCENCSSESQCHSCFKSYYLDTITKLCLHCDSDCTTCIEPGYCHGCKTGLKLLPPDPLDMTRYICVADCGADYFVGNDIYVCISITHAYCGVADSLTGCTNLICDTPFAHYQSQCFAYCKSAYYKFDTGTDLQCLPCPEGCTSCSSDIMCLSCSSMYYLRIDDETTHTCQKCKSNCYSCSNSDDCSKCVSGYYLNGTDCVLTCPAPKYSSSSTCYDCNIQYCEQCKNGKSCLKCQTGKVPVLMNCYDQCGYGYYRVGNTSSCARCPSNCGDCTSSTYCNTCMDGYYLINNQCSPCHSTCLTCNGPSSDNCLTCEDTAIETRFLFMNYCVIECPEYYYSNGFQSCGACSTDQSCLKCIDSKSCSKCANSSHYLVELTYCSPDCPATHTIYRNSYNELMCTSLICSDGFQVDPSANKCVEICGDGKVYQSECDDGNTNSGDGCSSTCKVEENFKCDNPSSSSSSYGSICKYQILYSLITSASEPNVVYLEFNQVVEFVDPNSLFKKLNKVIIKNTSEFGTNVISALNLKSTGNNYVIPAQSRNQQISLTYVESETTEKVTQVVKVASKTIQTAVLVSIIPLSVTGSINFVASIVDISQLIRFHAFIDIEQPSFLKVYFDDFEGFDFLFVINFFEYFLPENYSKPSFDSFTRYGTGAVFLDNAGQHYSILLFTLISHGLIAVVGRYSKTIRDKTEEVFKYNMYYEVIMSTYLEIIFYTILQCTNMDMDGLAIEIIGQVIMWITFCAMLPIPFIMAYLMKKYEGQLDDQSLCRHASLWKDLKKEYACRIYFVYMHIRKLWFSIFLIALNEYVIVSISFLLIPSIAILIFTLKRKPFEKNIENIKEAIQEICIISAEMMLIALKAIDGADEDVRQIIAWIIIGFFSIIMIMHFVSTLYEIYHTFLKSNLQKLIRKIKIIIDRKTSKVIPIHQKNNSDDIVNNIHQQIDEKQPRQPIQFPNSRKQKRRILSIADSEVNIWGSTISTNNAGQITRTSAQNKKRPSQFLGPSNFSNYGNRESYNLIVQQQISSEGNLMSSNQLQNEGYGSKDVYAIPNIGGFSTRRQSNQNSIVSNENLLSGQHVLGQFTQRNKNQFKPTEVSDCQSIVRPYPSSPHTYNWNNQILQQQFDTFQGISSRERINSDWQINEPQQQSPKSLDTKEVPHQEKNLINDKNEQKRNQIDLNNMSNYDNVNLNFKLNSEQLIKSESKIVEQVEISEISRQISQDQPQRQDHFNSNVDGQNLKFEHIQSSEYSDEQKNQENQSYCHNNQETNEYDIDIQKVEFFSVKSQEINESFNQIFALGEQELMDFAIQNELDVEEKNKNPSPKNNIFENTGEVDQIDIKPIEEAQNELEESNIITQKISIQ